MVDINLLLIYEKAFQKHIGSEVRRTTTAVAAGAPLGCFREGELLLLGAVCGFVEGLGVLVRLVDVA